MAHATLSPDDAKLRSVTEDNSSSEESLLSPEKHGPDASQSSIASQSSVQSTRRVTPKRQVDFERHFAKYTGDKLENRVVVATQSCDAQSNILLHGRLYLTHSHLCFRSNIMGYVTENVHPLKDIVAIERGTTAKWIQNAVYVYMQDDEEPEGIQFGYGSMADRDDMFTCLMDCWKAAAPGRYQSMMSIEEEAIEAAEETTSAAATRKRSVVKRVEETADIQTTTCSGEGHYDEKATDVTFPTTLDSLFNLLYHDEKFMMEFYQKDKELTEVVISQWADNEEGKKRELSYTMHMSGIGPSSSTCYGTETIVISNPDRSYEIVSETHTPDVPSGKKFTIRTRTCLMHAEKDSRQASRMYCTTQCDWSSSSWLQSTITPAVIKGQRAHHEELARKVTKWIRDRPDEYGVPSNGDENSDEVPEVKRVPVHDGKVDAKELKAKSISTSAPSTAVSSVPVEKSYLEYIEDLWQNPVAIFIISLLTSIIIYQHYQSCSC